MNEREQKAQRLISQCLQLIFRWLRFSIFFFFFLLASSVEIKYCFNGIQICSNDEISIALSSFRCAHVLVSYLHSHILIFLSLVSIENIFVRAQIQCTARIHDLYANTATRYALEEGANIYTPSLSYLSDEDFKLQNSKWRCYVFVHSVFTSKISENRREKQNKISREKKIRVLIRCSATWELFYYSSFFFVCCHLVNENAGCIQILQRQ